MSEYLSYMTDWREVLRNAKECDIIEFNRIKYSHYAFYVGNGICVHVIDRDDGDKGAGGLGRKCAMTLREVANGDGCRINNLEASRFWRTAGRQGFDGIQKRDKSEAVQLALKGISLNSEGEPLPGRENGVNVQYKLLGCNCEDYAVHWRYDVPLGGFSQQANNIIGSGLGIGQRALDAAFLACAEVADDEDAPVVVRVAAATNAIGAKAGAITVGTVKAVTDGVTSFVAGQVDSVFSWFK